MNTNAWKPTPAWSWFARGLGAMALALSGTMAQPALADTNAHITLYVVGAPSTAWVEVEWQSPADSSWHPVNGWQGNLDYTDSGAAYKQWTVASRDYGTGPFRWVVCAEEDGAVLVTSQTFKLPTDNSANLVMTLNAPATTVPAAATPKPAAATTTTTTTAASAPVLKSWTTNEGFDPKGQAIARITLKIAQVAPTTYVGVQYKDANGVWQDVKGWQTAATIDQKGVAVVQWAVNKANFGQGPMRWVVYGEKGGAVVGVSPDFKLPTDTGVNFVMNLSK